MALKKTDIIIIIVVVIIIIIIIIIIFIIIIIIIVIIIISLWYLTISEKWDISAMQYVHNLKFLYFH